MPDSTATDPVQAAIKLQVGYLMIKADRLNAFADEALAHVRRGDDPREVGIEPVDDVARRFYRRHHAEPGGRFKSLEA